MRILIIFCLLLIGVQLDGQDFAIEESSVRTSLLERINQLRNGRNLSPFAEAEVLDIVAFDQAQYILELGRVSHTQDNGNKETLKDRMLLYEALHAMAGENAAMIQLNSMQLIDNSGKKALIDSEETLIDAALYSWQNNSEAELNIYDPAFESIGITVLERDMNVVIVIITASPPYENPSNKKLPFRTYGLENYSKEKCDKVLKDHPTLPQLFSDAFVAKGNQVFFEYHSLDFFNHIMANSSDGIAIELVGNQQFNCEGANRLFPGDVTDGYLLKPSKKARLSAGNLLAEKGKVEILINELPDFYSPEQYEINGLIIINGAVCDRVPFNRFETKNLKQLEVAYLLAGDSIGEKYSWYDTLSYNIPISNQEALSNQHSNELQKRIKRVNLIELRVELTEQFSPADNELAEKKRAKEFRNQLVNLGIDSTQITLKQSFAWEEYQAFQENTYYQIETEGMSKPAISEYLKTSRAGDPQLDTFLNNLNQLKIKLTGKASFETNMETKELFDLYNYLSQEQKIRAASTIQKYLIERLKDDANLKDKFPTLDPSQKKRNLSLISNLIALADLNRESSFEGNPMHRAFLELYLVDQSNPYVSFNYHLALLRYWSTQKKRMTDPKSWIKEFQKLSSKQEIPKTSYARTCLFFNLLAADYYFDRGDFSNRKKAFDEIMRWKAKADLDEEEVLQLAKHLCHQDQLPRAVQCLEFQKKKKDLGAASLTYYLQILPYDTDRFNEQKYLDGLEELSENHPQQFCNFFSKKVQGIQPLKNLKVKELYCDKCP